VIHAVSPDPMAAPSICPNFLATEEDRQVMIDGMKIVRHIVEQATMDPFRQMELALGADCRTDDDWFEFAREDGQTIYHICGTAAWGRTIRL
jgi:choline dehydrogenase-like flavoprotein